MTILHKAYMNAVWFLSFGAIMSVIPIPGPIGWLVKLIMCGQAGSFFALHSLLIIVYTVLVVRGTVAFEKVQLAGSLSQLVVVCCSLPTLLMMLHGSHDFVGTGMSISPLESFSWLVWAGGPNQPREFSEYANITTTFRQKLPAVGPKSTEPVFLDSIMKPIMSPSGHEPLTSLETVFYPVAHSTDKRSNKKSGLLVFVPGGEWWIKDNNPFKLFLEQVHNLGWHAATVDYRLGRDGWSGDDQLNDVKDAIKHLTKTHKGMIDTSKVVLLGSSAGSHLALMAAYQLGTPTIAGVAAIAPSTSVNIGTSDSSKTTWNGAWDESLATKRMCEGVKNCHKELGPLEQVSSTSPPTLLAHSTIDQFYTVEHSQALRNKLEKFKIPHMLLELPLAPHAFEVFPSSSPFQVMFSALETMMKAVPLQPNSFTSSQELNNKAK